MKRKKIFLSLLTALLLALGCSIAAYGEEADKDVENTDFTVTLETGLDSVAVENTSMPVSVTIENSGKDFTGILRVIVPADYDKKSLAYERSITVPGGGKKTFSMLLQDIHSAAFLRVELENEKGKILYSKQMDFKSFLTGQNAVVGILSSDYSGLNYFDGVTIDAGYGTLAVKTLQLTAENIPETGAGLSACDYILIDNYNTSQLSEEQRSAIVSWTADGGVLIFGTGSKASGTLEAFQDTLAPVSIGSLDKQDMLVLDGDTGALVTEEAKTVDIAGISAVGWQDVQNSIAWGGPAWQSSYGSGSVLILSYDLAMEPLVSWKEARADLAANILEAAGNDNTVYDMYYGGTAFSLGDSYYMDQAVAGVDRNKMPNTLLYAAIYLVYIICIGPVMYLVLKAKDKREKMWIVMPAIALAFTVVVYGTSMAYKIHKPFIDAVSVVEYSNGSVATTTYMTVQSPKGRAYTVDLVEGYQDIGSWDEDVNYVNVGTTDYSLAVLQEGEAVQLKVNSAVAFTKQNLYARKEETQSGEGIQTNLYCSLSGFEGTVTNDTGYDLENVVVCYNDEYAFIGHMKDGETAQVSRMDVESMSYLGYELEEWMVETPDNAFLVNTDENRDLQDNQRLYLMMEDVANNLVMNQGIVFGMIDGYEGELVQGHGVSVYSKAVAVSYFYQAVEGYGNYTTFVEDINDYMVGGDYIAYTSDYPDDFAFFYDTQRRDMYGPMTVLYDFNGIDLTGAQLVNRDWEASSDTGGSKEEQTETYGAPADCKVEIWNYDTQSWSDELQDTGTVTVLTPYISEEGWMQIRYSMGASEEDDYVEAYAPQIMLIGGEQ